MNASEYERKGLIKGCQGLPKDVVLCSNVCDYPEDSYWSGWAERETACKSPEKAYSLFKKADVVDMAEVKL